MDRADGIIALENRLLRAFKTKGGFGILDKFLGQSLLWRRENEHEPFEQIQFPSHRPRVPTWSWMAYTGSISYFDIPLGGVDWAELGSPFQPGLHTKEPRNTIIADTSGFNKRQITNLFYDLPTNANKSNQECVVIAKSKSSTAFYLMIVAPGESPTAVQGGKWERIGIAFAEGHEAFILDRPAKRVEIW